MYFTNMEYAVSILVTSELRLPSVRKRGCCVPKINRGRETALPCPLYYSEPAGIDIMCILTRGNYSGKVYSPHLHIQVLALLRKEYDLPPKFRVGAIQELPLL